MRTSGRRRKRHPLVVQLEGQSTAVTSGRRGKRHPLVVRHERHRPAERAQLTKLELQRGHERVGRMQVVRLGTVEDR
jgi:hypothetical protein